MSRNGVVEHRDGSKRAVLRLDWRQPIALASRRVCDGWAALLPCLRGLRAGAGAMDLGLRETDRWVQPGAAIAAGKWERGAGASGR